MYNELKKEIDELNKEMVAVQKDVTFLRDEVTEIRTHVTNHIPHQIADIQKTLDERLQPIETKRVKLQGISEFLNLVVKIVVAAAGLVWTVLEIGKNIS